MNQVVKQERAEVIPITQNAITPMDMISDAVQGGADIAVVERLMALQERWEANQGRKAFDAAIANAKSEIPTITKNRLVDYESKDKTSRTTYWHEDLAGIAETVNPILSQHGLSYRFRSSQETGGMITVTCVLSHKDGYSEETSLSGGRDESGSKNNHQAIGSSVTYLQRYTLKLALGLAAAKDDDANSAEPDLTITDEQVSELAGMLVESGADETRFLGWAKVTNLSQLPIAKFGAAQAMLKKKLAGET